MYRRETPPIDCLPKILSRVHGVDSRENASDDIPLTVVFVDDLEIVVRADTQTSYVTKDATMKQAIMEYLVVIKAVL